MPVDVCRRVRAVGDVLVYGYGRRLGLVSRIRQANKKPSGRRIETAQVEQGPFGDHAARSISNVERYIALRQFLDRN